MFATGIVATLWTTLAVLGASADAALFTRGLLRLDIVCLAVWLGRGLGAHLHLALGRRHGAVVDDDGCAERSLRTYGGRWTTGEKAGIGDIGQPRRSRRNAHEHGQALDPNFLHLPLATLEHLPDGDSACDAMRNATVLRQVLPPQVDVVVEPPCPVRMRLHEDPQRVWPARLMVAECACPATSCRPRTAYVCTQIISPVVVVMADGDGRLRQHRVMLPSGCKCMTARATLVEYLDEDYK